MVFVIKIYITCNLGQVTQKQYQKGDKDKRAFPFINATDNEIHFNSIIYYN